MELIAVGRLLASWQEMERLVAADRTVLQTRVALARMALVAGAAILPVVQEQVALVQVALVAILQVVQEQVALVRVALVAGLDPVLWTV